MDEPTHRYKVPGWTVGAVEKERMGKCPTCKKLIPGAIEGLMKHMQKEHDVKMPEVRRERL